MRRLLWVLALAGSGLAIASGVTAQQPGHVLVKPANVKWADAPPSLPPGAKMAWIEGAAADPGPFTFRVKLPANYKLPPHWHPGIEHVTVLSGTFNLGMGETFDSQKLTALPAGSLVVMPPRTPHFVSVKEETIIQVHGVGPWGLNYVNPQDAPRKK